MTKAAESVLEQAMQLSDADRVELADRLEQSLATERGYDAAWEEEIRKRIAEIDSGEMETIPWRTAMEQIRRGDENE